MRQILASELEDFVSRSEAARLAGVTPSSFNIGRDSSLPWWTKDVRYIVIGGHYYFLRADVLEAAARRRRREEAMR